MINRVQLDKHHFKYLDIINYNLFLAYFCIIVEQKIVIIVQIAMSILTYWTTSIE